MTPSRNLKSKSGDAFPKLESKHGTGSEDMTRDQHDNV